jgi:hypothetical protein
MVLSESAPRRTPQAQAKLKWAVTFAVRAPQAHGRGSWAVRPTRRSDSRREGDEAGEAVRDVAPEAAEEYGM